MPKYPKVKFRFMLGDSVAELIRQFTDEHLDFEKLKNFAEGRERVDDPQGYQSCLLAWSESCIPRFNRIYAITGRYYGEDLNAELMFVTFVGNFPYDCCHPSVLAAIMRNARAVSDIFLVQGDKKYMDLGFRCTHIYLAAQLWLENPKVAHFEKVISVKQHFRFLSLMLKEMSEAGGRVFSWRFGGAIKGFEKALGYLEEVNEAPNIPESEIPSLTRQRQLLQLCFHEYCKIYNFLDEVAKEGWHLQGLPYATFAFFYNLRDQDAHGAYVNMRDDLGRVMKNVSFLLNLPRDEVFGEYQVPYSYTR